MRCNKPITRNIQQPISQNSKNTNEMQQTDYKEQYNNQLVRTVEISMRCNKPMTNWLLYVPCNRFVTSHWYFYCSN